MTDTTWPYLSEDTAQAAVRRNIREHGVWPGIIGPNEEGRYRLTYDAGFATARNDRALPDNARSS